MSIELRLPNITAVQTSDQMSQMKSYLYQLTKQLEFALNQVDSNIATVTTVAESKTSAVSMTDTEKKATFTALKSLIIKSADIVDAYYEEIDKKLSGEYVAQSTFGTYKETTDAALSETSTSLSTIYTDVQTLNSDVDSVRKATACIKSGKLYEDDEGNPVYGMYIGQKNEVEGEETFDKFAMFTADRLSFYDASGVEVAYISDYTMHITNAEVSQKLTLGGYLLDMTHGGIALKWVGEN